MTFQLIDRERAHHAVSLLCSVLSVTRQGFWAWKRRPPSLRRQADERLKPRILEAWNDSDRIYGAPRLHAELRLGDGIRVGKKRVARLMREQGIHGVSRRRGWVRTTIPDKRAAPAPDLVNRDFSAERPDETWVADITYVPTHEGWLFLAAVMDSTRARSSAGRCVTTSKRRSSSTRSRWRSHAASLGRASCITLIAARSTPRSQWDAPSATR
jgi:putative transposase